MQKVVLILLDGFSANYINSKYTPFLHELTKTHYYKRMKPPFGFEGTVATLLSGLSPSDHGIFDILKFSPGSSIFKFFSRLPRGLRRLMNKADPLCLKYLIIMALEGIPLRRFYIPFEVAEYVDIALRKPLYSRSALKVSLFNTLAEKHIPYIILTSFNMVERYLKRGQILPFTYIYLSQVDRLGHLHGPDSQQVKNTLTFIDGNLEIMVNNLLKKSKNSSIIITADHGMAKVERYLNVIDNFRDYNKIEHGKDYVAIIGGTMARFWVLDAKRKEYICSRIRDVMDRHSRQLKLLNHADLDNLGVPKQKTHRGDLFYVAYQGSMIVPNYYSGKLRFKGMHGYVSGDPWLDIPLIAVNVAGSMEKPTDLYSTIVSLIKSK